MSKQLVAITADNFSSVLGKLVTADNSLASRIQDLIVFGFAHYEAHNDSVYLTQLMNAGFRSVRTEAIKVYVQDHTNLVLRKDKQDESKVCFKIDKNSKAARFTAPTKSWTEYSGVGQAIPLDIDTALPAFINRLSKAIKGEGKKSLKEGTEEHAATVLAALVEVQKKHVAA